MADILYLDCVTSLDIDADRVIKGALDKLDKVVIIGYDKDGQEYFASSIAAGGTILWLMERFKAQLLNEG